RPRSHARHARARTDDERAGRGGGGRVRAHPSAQPPHPGDGLSSGLGAVVGVRPVAWGIVSTGHINRLVIPPAQESNVVELVALASRDETRAREHAQRWGIERAYGSYEALL